MEGRTPVPEAERIESLARHQATMVLFLSVNRIQELTERLCTAYPPETPVAVIYKASWPEQKIVMGTLADIAEKVREAGIRKTALVTVANSSEANTPIPNFTTNSSRMNTGKEPINENRLFLDDTKRT